MSAPRGLFYYIFNPLSGKSDHLLRALKYRNYRLFFTGQSVSLIGLWMQRVAIGWLAYRLTESAFLLGAVEFAGQIPVLLFGLFTGPLLERWDLRRVIVTCQILSMLQALLLALLTLSGTIQYWQLISLATFLGGINAFEIPARQSFVVYMVEDREDLGNAIALNSSLFNGARLVGPAIAGVVIAAVGEGICFLINSVTYLATILALVAMRLREPAVGTGPGSGNVVQNFREGITYAWHFPPIRVVLLSLVLMSFLGLPYLVLLPVFAKDILQGGPEALGFLMGASGIGALAASVLLALRHSPVGLGKTVAAGLIAFGGCVAAFALSRIFLLSLLLIVPVGFSLVIVLTGCNTLIQTLVDDDKRSRVMSLFVMSLLGVAPLGSLHAGWLASHIGAPAVLALGGSACVLVGLVLRRKLPSLKTYCDTIYRQKGLIGDDA